MTTLEMLEKARSVKHIAASLSEEEKNHVLRLMAEELRSCADEILNANRQDLLCAKENGISDVMCDRLRLDRRRIDSMADGILALIPLPDPCGRTLDEYKRADGLYIRKVSVPLGVVAIIYESRPNVTSDAAALLLKSGNVCVLRSGKEAHKSSEAIVTVLRRALCKAELPQELINIAEDITRQSAYDIMGAVGYVDLLIPRGNAGLIRACTEQAKVPCIQTGTGICHIYIDKSADIKMALDIVENAKTSRPSVCNAQEVCLVHKDIAEKFLPLLKERLCGKHAAHPVELRVDSRALKIIDGVPAGEKDFDTEFLDYILAVGVTDSADTAIEHIAKHSTGHSDAVIADDETVINAFCTGVDSAAVYVNASTRFTDGGEFGLGCEMGISTQKLHARGPMGLCELMTYKYIVCGKGHIR